MTLIPRKTPNPLHIKGLRTCLRCLQSFISEWAGNRICPYCKRKEELTSIHTINGSGPTFPCGRRIEAAINDKD